MFGIGDNKVPQLEFLAPTEEEHNILQANLYRAVKENIKNLWMILIISGLLCIGMPITLIKGIVNGTSSVQSLIFGIILVVVCGFTIWFVIAKKMPQTKEVLKLFKNGVYLVHHATPQQLVVKDFYEKATTQDGKLVYTTENGKIAELPVKFLSKQIKEKAKRELDGAWIVKIEGAKTLYGYMLFHKKSFLF